MDFEPSDDRRMLADTLGRFLADRYDFEARKRITASESGFDLELWRSFAELGVIGALFPESAGGFGGGGFDIRTVFEAIGRSLVVEPFFATLLAGRILAGAGGHEQLLGALIEGSRIATAALYEPQGRYDHGDVETTATLREEGYALDGVKAVVPALGAASDIVVSARFETGIACFVVPSKSEGVLIRDYGLIDGGRGGELMMRNVVLPRSALLARGPDALSLIETAIAAGLVALTSEAVGAMEFARDATVDYLRTRTQFGVPIGKFQALQHRMATMLLEIEQARSGSINAASALDGDPAERDRSLSAAKYTVGRVGALVAEESIQMHGGIGMTWELPLPHYAKRLTMIDHMLGDEDHHLARYVRLTTG